MTVNRYNAMIMLKGTIPYQCDVVIASDYDALEVEASLYCDGLVARIRKFEEALRELQAACVESQDLYYASMCTKALGSTAETEGKQCERCGNTPCPGCQPCCGSTCGRDPEDGSCLGCG